MFQGRISNKKLVFIFIILLASTFGMIKAEPEDILNWVISEQPGLYEVVAVNDGDTILVDMNGKTETIRFIGVDTPETHHPSKPVQCFGKAATEYTTNKLLGAKVRLEADPLSDGRDIYNRLLRYVYAPDNELVNRQLIEDGYGFAYVAFPHSKLTEFRAAEKQAREDQRGLWSGCELQENKYGQTETAPE